MLVSSKKSALYLKSYFKQIGLKHIVLCPGSRNLPLIVTLSNDPYFQIYSLMDERVAGFFALGAAKALRKPVAVVTTSGSAAVNLAPAMVEAYYQRLPLLALTADRPASYIQKGENQTIVQRGIFRNFVGMEIDIEENCSFEAFEKAIQPIHPLLTHSHQLLNVHINLPFSEPLDAVDHILGDFTFKLKADNRKMTPRSSVVWKNKDRQNVIFYLSTNFKDAMMHSILDRGVEELGWVVITEATSTWSHPKAIANIDLILSGDKAVQSPDILITIGENMLSKKFRNYIKQLKKIRHIDVSYYPREWNNLSKDYTLWTTQGNEWQDLLEIQNEPSFQNAWLDLESIAQQHAEEYFKELKYNEFHLIQHMLHSLPDSTHVYWGNSSVIRFGNWSNWKLRPDLQHLANRGVSGIDGVLASAIGFQSVLAAESFVCILGDISFLYEMSSLIAMSYLSDFKLIVINNRGGQIFRQIHHIEQLGESQALLTPQDMDIAKLVKAFNIQYVKSTDFDSFRTEWPHFLFQRGRWVFEIQIEEKDIALWKDFFA